MVVVQCINMDCKQMRENIEYLHVCVCTCVCTCVCEGICEVRRLILVAFILHDYVTTTVS